MMQKGVEDSRCYAREREGTVNTEDREACFGEWKAARGSGEFTKSKGEWVREVKGDEREGGFNEGELFRFLWKVDFYKDEWDIRY